MLILSYTIILSQSIIVFLVITEKLIIVLGPVRFVVIILIKHKSTVEYQKVHTVPLLIDNSDQQYIKIINMYVLMLTRN